MDLPRCSSQFSSVMWRETSTSTNAELRERALAAGAASLPHGAILLAAHQTAGRGRLGRGWETPPNLAVAASVLLRPPSWGRLGLSWIPLLAGTAMSETLQEWYPVRADGSRLRVGVKWPNDVHVRDEEDAQAGRPGRKLCGILSELLPDGSVIVGSGLNLFIPEAELPTERATSLLASGADLGVARSLDDEAGASVADRILAEYGRRLLAAVAAGVVDPDRVRVGARRTSLTLGNEVRVHLPERVVDGRARGLDDDGALILDLPTGGTLVVSAGDVEHLR